jgi:Relaxase/Mobilisation nuclease domain
VAYLRDPQGKKTSVGEVAITNCVSADTTWAVREIAATQRFSARAKSDRTYHLLVSLRAGENPDAQTLRVIEERFCKELGYAEHQRVSVVHHDPDNVHIHVAIDKIHPKTLTLHDRYRNSPWGRLLLFLLIGGIFLAFILLRRGPQPKPDNTQVRSSAHAGEWLFLRREYSVAAPRAAHAGGPSTA